MRIEKIKKWVATGELLTNVALAMATGWLMKSLAWGVVAFVVSILADAIPKSLFKDKQILQQSIIRKNIFIILFTSIVLFVTDNVFLRSADKVEFFANISEKTSNCSDRIEKRYKIVEFLNVESDTCRDREKYIKDGSQHVADNFRGYVNVFGAYWPSWWLSLVVWAMIRLLALPIIFVLILRKRTV